MRNKGFTLVELLVVIAIIGVLSVAIIAVVKPNIPNTATQQVKEAFYPEPTGYLVDSANVLSSKTKETLTQELSAFDQIAQVAVVTVKTTEPLDIEQYSIKLAEKWKVGYKGLDNGVILVVATDDRKLRIEVGRGLEGGFTDLRAKEIIDQVIVPYFKQGKLDEGVDAGVKAIQQQIRTAK